MGVALKTIEIVMVVSIILLIAAFIAGLLGRYVSLRGSLGCDQQTDSKKAEKCVAGLTRMRGAVVLVLIILGGLIAFSILMVALIVQNKSKTPPRKTAPVKTSKPAQTPQPQQPRKIKIVQKTATTTPAGISQPSTVKTSAVPTATTTPTSSEISKPASTASPPSVQRKPITVPDYLTEPVDEVPARPTRPAVRRVTVPDDDGFEITDVNPLE